MAKRETSSNNRPSEALDNSRNTGHPLLRNETQVMDILKKWKDTQESEEVVIERIEEYREALNRLVSTSDGIYFMKMMLKIAGVFSPRDTRNTVKMVENAGIANFYLKWVRPYLDSNLRKEIE